MDTPPYQTIDDVDPDDPRLVILPEQDRSVLLRRKTMTLRMIAAQDHLSLTRIHQIQNRALRRLRRHWRREQAGS